MVFCCPRAASGHDKAAPPTRPMNSRRLIAPSPCEERSSIITIRFAAIRQCRKRVKIGKAPCEHMFSAVHPTTDIAKMLRHVCFVPKAATRETLDAQRATLWWPIKRSAYIFAELRLLLWFCCLFWSCFHFFLLIAPVSTPIRASNAHGGEWITNAGLGIRCGHQRRRHREARRNREPKQGKNPSTRNHFRFDLFSHHRLLLSVEP